MIAIGSVRKRYGDVIALDGVSLDVKKGEFFGLLGPNGAGKSTLLNILVGYILPDSGTISMAGLDIQRRPMDVRRAVGFVPQEIALYDDLTGYENLHLFGSLYGLRGKQLSSRAEELLTAAGLQERKKERVKQYSGGMKRRLNIVASLMHSPSILLCDEPTVGVDPQSRNAIFEFLQSMHRSGVTIVYTTHYMEEAERLCTRIAIVDKGLLIAEDTLEGLLRRAPGKRGLTVNLTDEVIVDPSGLKEFGHVSQSGATLSIIPHETSLPMSQLLARLETIGVQMQDIRFERPTLESLFLHITGRSLRE